jgi:hypothetical protein
MRSDPRAIIEAGLEGLGALVLTGVLAVAVLDVLAEVWPGPFSPSPAGQNLAAVMVADVAEDLVLPPVPKGVELVNVDERTARRAIARHGDPRAWPLLK